MCLLASCIIFHGYSPYFCNIKYVGSVSRERKDKIKKESKESKMREKG